MTYQAFTLEGVDGVDITTGNSGASLVTGQGAGLNTAKFSAADAFGGSTGARFATVSGGNAAGSVARFSFAPTGQLSASVSLDIALPAALPSSGTYALFTLRGSSTIAAVSIRSTGEVFFQDSNTASGSAAYVLVPAGNYSSGKRIRITLTCTVGTSTSNSSWSVKCYDYGNSALLGSANTTTGNLGTTAPTTVQVGVAQMTTLASIGYDNIQLNGGSAVEMPEYAPPSLSANAGSDKYTNVNSSTTLDGSGTGGNGTLTYSWSQVSARSGAVGALSNATAATATVLPTAGGVLTYRLTVTDSQGNTATDLVDVLIPSATARPVSITANPGSWLSIGGAADGAVALADELTTTYVQAPAAPSTPQTSRYRLAPLSPGSGFSLTITHLLNASGTGTAKVRLYEGSTLRKEWTLTPTTDERTDTLTLTAAELATITSLSALDVELSWGP